MKRFPINTPKRLSASEDVVSALEVWEGEGGYVPSERPTDASRAVPDWHGGFVFAGGRR